MKPDLDPDALVKAQDAVLLADGWEPDVIARERGHSHPLPQFVKICEDVERGTRAYLTARDGGMSVLGLFYFVWAMVSAFCFGAAIAAHASEDAAVWFVFTFGGSILIVTRWTKEAKRT